MARSANAKQPLQDFKDARGPQVVDCVLDVVPPSKTTLNSFSTLHVLLLDVVILIAVVLRCKSGYCEFGSIFHGSSESTNS